MIGHLTESSVPTGQEEIATKEPSVRIERIDLSDVRDQSVTIVREREATTETAASVHRIEDPTERRGISSARFHPSPRVNSRRKERYARLPRSPMAMTPSSLHVHARTAQTSSGMKRI